MTTIGLNPPPGDAAVVEPWPPAEARHRPVRGWRELGVCYVFYFTYSHVRDGSRDNATKAFRNARRLVDWERDLGIYHELAIQRAVLAHEPVVILLNVFYTTAHFFVTPAVLIWIARYSPTTYRRWRNVLAGTTAAALVAFYGFPLAPPRLVRPLGFVDTIVDYPNAWRFSPVPVWNVGNPYAAMPSLHMAWALWVGCVMLAHLRRPAARAIACAYPTVTLLAIVATGNHYLLDAVGGVVVFWIGAQVIPLITGSVVGLVTRTRVEAAIPVSAEAAAPPAEWAGDPSVRSQRGPHWGMEGTTRLR